ncbi:PepSY domain-containing protein [Marisediminicola senii]|uniref:PepSY domain-containing protein n=1 Tax=Marisediminicola senii TaxID=2711233 RepID=UPI0013EC0DCE|nr:PepSY domain-containing protein [Marisediminicola senii]
MKKRTAIITGSAVAAVLVVGGIGVAVAEPWDRNDQLTGTTLERASSAALAAVGDGRVTNSERSDDPDHAFEIEVTRDNGEDVDVELDDAYEVVRIDGDDDPRAIGGGAAGGATADSNDAGSNSGDSNNGNLGTDDGAAPGSNDAAAAPGSNDAAAGTGENAPITDAERASAEQAALAEAGNGTVTELERSDDADHAWEVEVTRDDGTDVDIELDASFAVTKVDQ